jgi:hypothetical protein
MKKSANRHLKQSKNTFAKTFLKIFSSGYQAVRLVLRKNLIFRFGKEEKYPLSLHPLYKGMALE